MAEKGMIQIDIDYQDAAASLKLPPDQLKNNVESYLARATAKVADEARRVHRYTKRTGKLNNAVKHEIRDYTASVFIDDDIAPHGKYIHNGTRHRSPDPFVQEALDRNEAALMEAVDRGIDDTLRMVGF